MEYQRVGAIFFQMANPEKMVLQEGLLRVLGIYEGAVRSPS
jgi:hypothetical protein